MRWLLMLALAATTVIGPAANAATADKPKLATTTLAGEAWDIATHRGSYVVVNFWATWCAPCVKEMPELDAFDRARDDVVVIGLAFDESPVEDVKAFLEKRPVSYAIAMVDVYAPPADFEIPRGLPMTYLIAPDGAVAQKFLGPVTGEEIAAAITKHGGRSTPKTPKPVAVPKSGEPKVAHALHAEVAMAVARP